jgi:hypothetical protein
MNKIIRLNKNSRLFKTFSSLFNYNTERSASIKSLRVGIVYRLTQIAILVYIIGYELIYSKGYQSFDEVSSVITSKVKGEGYVAIKSSQYQDYYKRMNKTDTNFYEKLFKINKKLSYRIFDTADYVVPAIEFNSIFIMTNFLELQQKLDCKQNYNNITEECDLGWLPEENM